MKNLEKNHSFIEEHMESCRNSSELWKLYESLKSEVGNLYEKQADLMNSYKNEIELNANSSFKIIQDIKNNISQLATNQEDISHHIAIKHLLENKINEYHNHIQLLQSEYQSILDITKTLMPASEMNSKIEQLSHLLNTSSSTVSSVRVTTKDPNVICTDIEQLRTFVRDAYLQQLEYHTHPINAEACPSSLRESTHQHGIHLTIVPQLTSSTYLPPQSTSGLLHPVEAFLQDVGVYLRVGGPAEVLSTGRGVGQCWAMNVSHISYECFYFPRPNVHIPHSLTLSCGSYDCSYYNGDIIASFSTHNHLPGNCGTNYVQVGTKYCHRFRRN